MTSCPAESFPRLDALPFLRAAFLQRCPGVDVKTDRETALNRLRHLHREAADRLGFQGQPFVHAEQVHGTEVALVESPPENPLPRADALLTSSPALCLAIYVADCAPVYLADPHGRAIALVHSGKKGTEGGIVPRTIAKLEDEFGIPPSDLILQIGPCIRPPHYEIDLPTRILEQAAEAGVGEAHDCGTCTASHPDRYYSYRREKGHTGRLLALMALRAQVS